MRLRIDAGGVVLKGEASSRPISCLRDWTPESDATRIRGTSGGPENLLLLVLWKFLVQQHEGLPLQVEAQGRHLSAELLGLGGAVVDACRKPQEWQDKQRWPLPMGQGHALVQRRGPQPGHARGGACKPPMGVRSVLVLDVLGASWPAVDFATTAATPMCRN